MTHTVERSATVKHASRPGLEELSRGDQPLHDDAVDRRSDQRFAAPDLTALSDLVQGLLVDSQRMQLQQGRVAVGFGGDGVRFGLLLLAARQGVVLEELRVQIGDAPEVSGGDLGLAIGADRDAEVGRGDAREGLGLLDRGSHVDEQPRDGARDGGEHLGGLVGVEGHGAGGFERAAEVRHLDLLHADLRALRRREGSGCRRGSPWPPSCPPSRRRP